MAVKLLKAPKKPKSTASISAKERFLQRVKEIQRENAKRLADAKKSKDLDKKISSAINGLKGGCK